MEETLIEILSELQKTNGRLENLDIGQTEITKNTKRLEEGQKELNNYTKRLEEGQKELNSNTKRLEEGQKELITGQHLLTTRMENLERSQDELKDLIKHTTTLMTENFTYIRKDMKSLAFEVNADVELLFKEVGEVKRKVNKLEHKY
jgi:uncharacterized phage infection (PIP) family protein YhgE